MPVCPDDRRQLVLFSRTMFLPSACRDGRSGVSNVEELMTEDRRFFRKVRLPAQLMPANRLFVDRLPLQARALIVVVAA